ncbi:DUF445 domain-containing protein [Psychrosphaera sp. 1_MG-2023]|uniref:DUF445 domain-containing protein n=1 Tax=Psychrosphaera sp. 1_MG-2023 TaxID=3062643 RepID=UPI0026E182B2|nr:DUF445 domain-containing protein [Psychrosphaera sp. 1_MG-2023]MDO6721465.1 DUF445 domain-containing protein [Psychrosphaera sp. 1_MG-2023]
MNKSLLTNLIAFVACVIGWQFSIEWLFITALFALSGAVTNWLAVHMLFEKIPGLYGSGVVQVKFKQFKNGIQTLIMEQFFTEENLSKFMSEQNTSPQPAGFDLKPIIEDVDLSPAFDSLIVTIQNSSFGSMLGMLGGVEALAPMREPFVENLKTSIVEISQTDDFQQKLLTNLSDPQHMSDIKQKVDAVVSQRLDELTPQMVKTIIQDMIRTHLGWLVVWGGVFGGLIGFGAHLAGI